MRIPTIAVVVLLVAGCHKPKKLAPVDCSVVPPAVERVMGELAKDPAWKSRIARTQDTMRALCEKDVWQADVLHCIADSQDRQAIDDCRGALTKDQQEHVKNAERDLRDSAGPPPGVGGAEAGSGSAAEAGSGSGEGSAKAGSGG